MHSVEGDKLVIESRALFTAVTPLSLSILGNTWIMSKQRRMVLSGIPVAYSYSNISIRWYEPFIFVGMFSVNVGQCFSTNIARFSMALLHPVVRSLTGIFGLCVL